ncbi:MAG: AMP-binding protein, partial [Firmicutes bacterium]|nr:AMP-binding protein [Bacillota bacterium]
MKPILYDEKKVEEYTKKGYWTTKTLTDYWEEFAEKYPDREALVDTIGNRLTFAEVVQQVNRIALGFIELGLEKDDRVAIQLPNRVEGFLTRLACEKAGLISIALMQVFRHAELLEILGTIEAKAIIIPLVFRKFNYYEMVREIAAELPHLKHIIVAGDEVPEGAISLSGMIQNPLEEKYSPDVLAERKMNAFDVGFLTSTTGTTGLPKIVERMFAANLCSTATHVRNWQLTEDDILCAVAPFPGAPGGTPTYFCAPQVGAKVVLLHQYNPEAALKVIEEEKITVPCLVPAQLAAMMQFP